MITIVFIYLSVIVLNAIMFREKGLVHNKLPSIPILMFSSYINVKSKKKKSLNI